MRGLSSRGLRLHRHRDDRRRDTGNESEHQGWEDGELAHDRPRFDSPFYAEQIGWHVMVITRASRAMSRKKVPARDVR